MGSGNSRTALVERFTGTKWTVQPTPTIAGESSSLLGVSCFSATECVAVGYTEKATSTYSTALAERWNGSTWTILPSPEPPGSFLRGVSCSAATECFAVGNYRPANSPDGLLAERWDGGKWFDKVTETSIGGGLAGISCFSATACTAVGSLSEGDFNIVAVVVWNGSAWQGSSGPAGSDLFGVSCISATGCTVVGSNSNPETPVTTTLAAQHS
jgi:hypothetical protein